MTTELEKQFFKTYEIETQEKSYCLSGYCKRQPSVKFGDNEICRNCKNGNFYTVPEISDRGYLELICIVYKAKNSLNSEIDIFELNVEKLKITVLERLIWINKTYKSNKIKHQVQAIFEGER